MFRLVYLSVNCWLCKKRWHSKTLFAVVALQRYKDREVEIECCEGRGWGWSSCWAGQGWIQSMKSGGQRKCSNFSSTSRQPSHVTLGSYTWHVTRVTRCHATRDAWPVDVWQRDPSPPMKVMKVVKVVQRHSKPAPAPAPAYHRHVMSILWLGKLQTGLWQYYMTYWHTYGLQQAAWPPN